MRFFVVCLVVFLSTVSCYKRVEGCLDIQSSNYNPNADDPCEDCCTNPIFRITIKHQIDSTFYSANDTIINSLDQQYKILDFAYYLSDFTPYSVGDTLEGLRKIDVVSGLLKHEISDNFILVKPNVFDYTINEIRRYGQYDQLYFIVGLNHTIRTADSIAVSENHVLSDSLFVRDSNQNKSWGYLSIAKGDGFSDTLNLHFNLSEMEVPVVIEKTIQNNIGTGLSYSFVVNYAEWFKDVDFGLSAAEIKNVVKSNLQNGFYVE